jgi:hypothetical protein
MATVLIAWELGAGLGHLVQLLPLAHGLARRGHRVYAALRDLSKAEGVFGPKAVQFLQAPYKSSQPRAPIRPPATFGQILHNVSFSDVPELRTLTAAWRNLYHLVRPDLVVFDHSPTALLAARAGGDAMRRVVIGSGFCVPPDVSPMQVLRRTPNGDPQKVAADEAALLRRINHLLGEWGRQPLERVTQLYGDVDETFLVTFPELDHFQGRRGTEYRGPALQAHGKEPQWPAPGGAGRLKIYAYLKNFDALPALLEALKKSGHATIVVVDGIPAALSRQFACETLRFEDRPLDIARVAQECDLAILNAGHGTSASMLLAGKPVLQVPIYLEQGLLAKAVERQIGAGLEASHKDGAEVVAKFEQMLASDQYAAAARAFAARYATFDAARENRRMLERLETLLPRKAPPSPFPAATWSSTPVGPVA